MWFTEFTGNKVGRISMDGKVTEYPIPTAGSVPVGIAPGPDGAVWFTERSGNKIGRISMEGLITEYPVPMTESTPVGITAGPDGAMWFTTRSVNGIGRITMDGKITGYPVPAVGAVPYAIAVGLDGAMWFTDRGTSRLWSVGTGRGLVDLTRRADSIDVELFTPSWLRCRLEVSSDMVSWRSEGEVMMGGGGHQTRQFPATPGAQFWRLGLVR
jgi:streptogramin lyase